MFDEQRVDRHLVAIHHQPVIAGALVPADMHPPTIDIAMVGPPDPHMIGKDVMTVDLQTGLHLAHLDPANAEEQVGQQDRVVPMIAVAARRANPHQHG
ncbi:hypothetical protein D9M73_119400 [compost metagenome]